MCHRISPLLRAELEEALEMLRVSGRARLPRRDPGLEVKDAYPGTEVPLFVPAAAGGLEVASLTWGFDAPQGSSGRYVFNTRIETALSQARSGKGLWAGPILQGRCLVPVRAFFERGTRLAERGVQVRFRLAGRSTFLLAGVYEADRFSVVTTEPNASVAPVHSRMPLVLAPGESATWLGPDFARLMDRSALALEAEREGAPTR